MTRCPACGRFRPDSKAAEKRAQTLAQLKREVELETQRAVKRGRLWRMFWRALRSAGA